jgi:hypothetical protein
MGLHAHPLLDAAFAPPIILPYRPGESPFRQKGNAYLGDVRYLDSVAPGGFRAVVASLHDPALRAFFEQPFRASDWYDAYPGTALERAAARLRGVSFERHRRETGAWHAVDATRGIYSALLKMVSTESVALWGPRISNMYFEFGKTESRIAGDRVVDVSRGGVPHDLAQWLIYASEGFCEEALRRNGARDPVMKTLDVVDDGVAEGRPVVKFLLRVTWR